MIRLLGFVIGSAASLGTILLILGVPDVNLSQPTINTENTESTVQIVAEVKDEVNEEVMEETSEYIADDLPVEKDLKWHAFWNPFRSRIAAEGFVGQLEKVTGLDYRVIKIETGVYEVAFGYEDDAEREDKMSLIASATGLDLPKS